jgi:uncharacterized membrane protein
MPFNIGPGEIIIVLILVGFWIGLPLLAIYLLRQHLRAREAGRQPDPRAVLAQRLALGQITPAEFETAMRALGFVAPPER